MTFDTEKLEWCGYTQTVKQNLEISLFISTEYMNVTRHPDRRPLFNFPHHCGIGDFRRLFRISYSHNPQHFGSDPADIRIWINPEIRIRIPDHFWLRFRPWWS